MHFTSIASIAPLNSCQLAEQRGALGLNQGKELKCISIALKLNRITFHITDVKIIASKKMSPHDKLNIRNYRNVTGVHFTLNFKFIVIEFEYIWLQLNFVWFWHMNMDGNWACQNCAWYWKSWISCNYIWLYRNYIQNN